MKLWCLTRFCPALCWENPSFMLGQPLFPQPFQLDIRKIFALSWVNSCLAPEFNQSHLQCGMKILMSDAISFYETRQNGCKLTAVRGLLFAKNKSFQSKVEVARRSLYARSSATLNSAKQKSIAMIAKRRRRSERNRVFFANCRRWTAVKINKQISYHRTI